MARATLMRDNGLNRIYKTATHKVVILEMNEEWTEIVFKTKNGGQFGEFVFQDLDVGTYKLMRMYSEPNQGGGIGRAALQMFRDVTGGALVYSSPNDGIQRDDQSHLTQDAPGFVSKMIKEGLIAGYEGSHYIDNGFIDM